jgi:two-component system sensor histidine kinase KdpD
VISRAPGNSGDPRLASLDNILRHEVDRLNNDVQDLLDAALISGKGVRLNWEWVEPADIVNAAVDCRQRLLSGHRVLLDVSDELPFIHVDPILLEQALVNTRHKGWRTRRHLRRTFRSSRGTTGIGLIRFGSRSVIR